jgi:hypothetical protein
LKIKLTNEQILKTLIVHNKEGIPNLNPIWEEMKKKNFPVSFQYWLKIAFKKMVETYEAFEESRQELVTQHSIKDDKGEPVVKENMMTMEDPVKFQEDFQELLKIETPEMDKIKINFTQWDSNPKLDVLSSDEMDLLFDIIEEV